MMIMATLALALALLSLAMIGWVLVNSHYSSVHGRRIWNWEK